MHLLEGEFGKHSFRRRLLWTRGRAWAAPSLVPTERSRLLSSVLPQSQERWHPPKVPPARLLLFQAQPRCQQVKNGSWGNYHTAHVLAEPPEFIKFASDFSKEEGEEKNPPLLKSIPLQMTLFPPSN